uniref:Ground-like domain-containing protein n=1 Tax=Ascaris lumbricoides TaxID=6252 RepID=A0A0M3I722_ASCLU
MDWIRVDEEPRPVRCHRMSGIAWNRDPYSFNQGADTCLSHCTKFVGMTRWIIVLLVFACELRCFVNSTMGRPRNPECPPPPPPGPPPVPCSGRGPLVDPSTGEDRLCTSAELRSAILKMSLSKREDMPDSPACHAFFFKLASKSACRIIIEKEKSRGEDIADTASRIYDAARAIDSKAIVTVLCAPASTLTFKVQSTRYCAAGSPEMMCFLSLT